MRARVEKRSVLGWNKSLVLANGSLNNELTLTMQNIGVTQATTYILRDLKKELETKSQKISDEGKLVLTRD